MVNYRLVDCGPCDGISWCACLLKLPFNRYINYSVIVWFSIPLSLGGHVESRENKSFVFARQTSARREFGARLAVQKQNFLFF